MAIGLPNAGTPTIGSGTSSPFPYPATTTAGRLLVLEYTQFSAGTTVSTPAGWTLREYVQSTAGGTAGNAGLFWKFADGTEGGTNLTVAHQASGCCGQIVEWPGVDPTTPFDVADATVDDNNPVNNTTTIGPIVPVTAGVTLGYLVSDNAAAHTVIDPHPSGFTTLFDGAGSSSLLGAGYAQNQPASSASVTLTFSGTGKQVGILYALRPAPTVAGGIGWDQVIQGPQPRTHGRGHGSLSYALSLAAAGSMQAHGNGRRRYPHTAYAARGTGDQAERLARQWAELERLNVL